MGASESVILYQKDIANLFPAGEINLDMACEIVKCTPPPKNTIEDFCNMRNNISYKYLYIYLVILLFSLFFLYHIK